MTGDGLAADGLPGDPRPPKPLPVEYVLANYGPDVLAGLLDEGRSCPFCHDEHPARIPVGACPLRVVHPDELSDPRRRWRHRLS